MDTNTDEYSSSVRPQDDFYRYINGPWIDSYELPDDRSRFGSFDKLAEDAEADVRDILEDTATPAKKSSILYRSFLDTEALEKAGIDPIRAELETITSATTKAELLERLGSLNPAGGPDLIGIAVYPNPGDSSKNVAHIVQAGIGLPDEAYYREDRYQPVRTAYAAMISRFFTLAKIAHNDEEANNLAQQVLNLETKIAAHHWSVVETRDEDKTYNPATWDELSAKLPHLDLAAWVAAWQKAYNATTTAAQQPLDFAAALNTVVIHEPSFLTGLDSVWNSESLDAWKTWSLAHQLMARASYLTHDFEQASFDFYGKVLSGTTQIRDRWKRAVSLVNGISGEEVGKVYVDRHFPAESKARMETLVSNLIKAYRVSITSSSWLGEDTKSKALEKLAKFSPKIGYTSHWRDYSALDVSADADLVSNVRAASVYEAGFQIAKAVQKVDKDEWLMNPQTVNAYYEPTMNVIVFPAAILQPPFFDPDADDATNYGGIGAVIGHEIGHGFDDQGSKYDGDGKLNDWWTAEDRANFEKLTKALIEQYNAFTPFQLQQKYDAAGEPDKAPHVNGAFTIGENIGDLSGVNIALKAYVLSLGKSADSPTALADSLVSSPEINGRTAAQRFFISYASIWRSKTRDELAEQYLAIDPHSPAEFRTNGIVRNVDAFYDAFTVTEKDRMWLDSNERVRIW
ncbi:MAG: peptidase M13 [Bifidobacteriaceae bacterium]|jgi:putative endopeptidase|nr:peptidase M13 [Bifidobacteriaceae bacterium]